ncbi:MAG: 16S rRNA (uracil(1498)-N(3))-methyltransferase [Fimbriimonadaceae bacterium]|nr:16S rRNA (uracil(1498)-N(3))-methyltransferase [Fimbriimonadaceae bacterium]
MSQLPMRALPRAFVDAPVDPTNLPDSIPLPEEDFKKFKNVLRLGTGDQVAILPGNGAVIRCELAGKTAIPIEVEFPETESKLELTLALGISKPDALEDSIRMASELGVAHFVLFTARRTVAKWEPAKFEKKLVRLQTISREACEVAYRTKLPTFSILKDLSEVLREYPDSLTLSEMDYVTATLPKLESNATLIIGPEGGWDQREVALIADRSITLGPRVLRVATAVTTACALALSNQ